MVDYNVLDQLYNFSIIYNKMLSSIFLCNEVFFFIKGAIGVNLTKSDDMVK